MTVAIYKGKGESIVERVYIFLIYVYQRYVLKSKYYMYTHMQFRFDDTVIGSSHRHKGVFKGPYNKHNTKYYDYIDIPIIPYYSLLKFYDVRKDYGYDLTSILLGNILHTNIEDTTKYTCSEFVYEFLLDRHILDKHMLGYNVTPAMVIEMLVEEGYAIT